MAKIELECKHDVQGILWLTTVIQNVINKKSSNNCMFRSLWLAIGIFIVVHTFKANLCCKSH